MFCPKSGKDNVDNGRPKKRAGVIAVVMAAMALLVLLVVSAALPAFRGKAGTGPAAESAGFSSGEAAGSVGGTDPAGAIRAGYADIVNANRGRPWYLASEYDYDSNSYLSGLIDHGSYYEVTKGCIYADVLYDLSIMDHKKAGDTLQINHTVYRITDIIMTDSGEDVRFEYVSGADDGYWTLRRNPSGNFYSLVGEDAVTEKDLLYTGSLYFSKNCKTSALDPENNFERHSVTFKDYVTLPSYTVGAEHGLSANGGFRLWGNFEMDTSGLITSYDEYFEP